MVEQAMKMLGFSASDTGPYATALREELTRLVPVAAAMQNKPEERARMILQLNWQLTGGIR